MFNVYISYKLVQTSPLTPCLIRFKIIDSTNKEKFYFIIVSLNCF